MPNCSNAQLNHLVADIVDDIIYFIIVDDSVDDIIYFIGDNNVDDNVDDIIYFIGDNIVDDNVIANMLNGPI
jgi:dTDP-D-glucose 4,6-dehydratase